MTAVTRFTVEIRIAGDSGATEAALDEAIRSGAIHDAIQSQSGAIDVRAIIVAEREPFDSDAEPTEPEQIMTLGDYRLSRHEWRVLVHAAANGLWIRGAVEAAVAKRLEEMGLIRWTFDHKIEATEAGRSVLAGLATGVAPAGRPRAPSVPMIPNGERR